MRLLQQGSIKNNIIKNRVAVGPFSDNQAERNGWVSQTQYDNLMRVAKQGVGMIIIDSAYICKQGRGLISQLGLSEEDHIAGLRNLVRLLKEDGAFVGIRLSHAGAKTKQAICGEVPIGPSAMQINKEYDNCRAFDEYDIKEVCTFFAHAAERAEEAGLDFIEINGAQNLLLDQCLNPNINTRDDQFGGDLTNRFRLSVDVIKHIKKRIGKQMLLSFMFNSPLDREEKEQKGLEELDYIIKTLIKEKVDIIHPVFSTANYRINDGSNYLLEYINTINTKPLIIEGCIKTTTMILELESIVPNAWQCLDKSMFIRQNWYQFLDKKLSKTI